MATVCVNFLFPNLIPLSGVGTCFHHVIKVCDLNIRGLSDIIGFISYHDVIRGVQLIS
jgi:hypothetical protein